MAKRFARFYPHRHLDQAHTVRAWRDLVHCFCPGMEILRLRRLTGGFTQDDGKRNACFCPHRHLDQAHTVRAWRDLVHCFCPGMEILRLRRLTGGFTQDDGKRNACFCPHRHLDQAHAVRAWRDLFFRALLYPRHGDPSAALRSAQDDGKGAALLTALFLGKPLQKILCAPHPSLRDTFPPRGRNGMKDYCACPTLWPSPLARRKVAALPSDEGCPALFTRRGRTASAARETLQS